MTALRTGKCEITKIVPLQRAMLLVASTLCIGIAVSLPVRAEDAPAVPAVPVPVEAEADANAGAHSESNAPATAASPASEAPAKEATAGEVPVPGSAATAEAPAAVPAPPPAVDAEVVEDYCREFASTAADARVRRQMEDLKKVQTEVDGKIKQVEERTKELKDWVSRREALMQKANKDLVKIYGQIEPDAAARQLEKLDPGTGAAILRQLNSKRAGEILSIMDTEKATRVVRIMADDAARKTGKQT